MLNKINSITFEGKFHLNGYSKHTPKSKPYDKYHFMPELQTKNPIKRFFEKIFDVSGSADDLMKPEKI